MAAPQILDSTFRAQIHTDLLAVLTGANAPVAIHDQRPRLSKGAAEYPYCVALLNDFQQQQAGLRRVTQVYEYEIVFVGLLSAVTGALDPAKVVIANLIIAQLMASNQYASTQGLRMVTGVDIQGGRFNDDDHPTFEVSVKFQITIDGLY